MANILAKLAVAAALALPGLYATGASAAPAGLGLATTAQAAGTVQEALAIPVDYHRGWRGPPRGRDWRGPPRRGYYGPPRGYSYGYYRGPRCRTVYQRQFRPGWGWRNVPVRVCR